MCHDVLDTRRPPGRAYEDDAEASTRDVLSGCRIFHFHDTSRMASPLRRCDIGDRETLHGDARNLAAVLRDAGTDHDAPYRRTMRSIRNVAPFFDDFALDPDGDSVMLGWREAGLDDVFSGSALSSGTFRSRAYLYRFSNRTRPRRSSSTSPSSDFTRPRLINYPIYLEAFRPRSELSPRPSRSPS